MSELIPLSSWLVSAVPPVVARRGDEALCLARSEVFGQAQANIEPRALREAVLHQLDPGQVHQELLIERAAARTESLGSPLQLELSRPNTIAARHSNAKPRSKNSNAHKNTT